MGEPEIRIERDPNPDAAQLAAWRALWRLLLAPRRGGAVTDRRRAE